MTAFAIRTFLTLFIVLDPIGLGPLFLALSANREDDERRRIARRAVGVATGVMLVFALAGVWLLESLRIRLDAFRVAGGLLLFKIAFDMVFAQLVRETREEAAEALEREDISVFPLAVPLIAGPGALASSSTSDYASRPGPPSFSAGRGSMSSRACWAFSWPRSPSSTSPMASEASSRVLDDIDLTCTGTKMTA
jgi:multiple antibiotic resistance protein